MSLKLIAAAKDSWACFSIGTPLSVRYFLFTDTLSVKNFFQKIYWPHFQCAPLEVRGTFDPKMLERKSMTKI